MPKALESNTREKVETVADWDGLRGYIRANYKIAKDDLNVMHLLFETEAGRTQLVYVEKLADTGWAEISTAVCKEGDINPRDALIRNSRMTVGALALVDGGPVIFRHSFPLANLEPSEFEEPLRVVVNYGDQLERELGGDRF